MRTARGIGWLALVLAMAGGAQEGRAAHMSARLTQVGGMNAVRIQGQAYTYRDLDAKRALNPARFDRYHPRLGSALAQGAEALLARQAINPRRFNFFHPLLAYLLEDMTPDAPPPGIDVTGDPDLPPLVIDPPPETGPQPGGVGGVAVPEPASLLMMGAGLAGIGLASRRAHARVVRRRKA